MSAIIYIASFLFFVGTIAYVYSLYRNRNLQGIQDKGQELANEGNKLDSQIDQANKDTAKHLADYTNLRDDYNSKYRSGSGTGVPKTD